jgi:DNA gyrase/topoisomerase IV subunit B
MSKITLKKDFKGEVAETKDFRSYALSRPNDVGNIILETKYYDIPSEDGSTYSVDKISISDAFCKIVDEAITNAADQWIKSPECTTIRISIKDGKIVVKNDGPGIPLYVDEVTKVYSVEQMFTKQYTSTNYNEGVNPDSITGGHNGLGIKLTNVYSNWMDVYTVSGGNRYKQVYREGMLHIDKPDIVKSNRKECTIVGFIPNYDHLCRVETNKPNVGWFKTDDQIVPLIRKRAYEISAYLSNVLYHTECGKKIKYTKKSRVFFNGKRIPPLPIGKWASMWGNEPIVHVFKPSCRPLSLAITITKNSRKFKHYCLINGVHTPELSDPLNEVIKQIEIWVHGKVEELIGKKLEKLQTKHFRKYLHVWCVAMVPKSMINFKGQTKSKVTLSTTGRKQWKRWYSVPTTLLEQVWLHLKPILLSVLKKVKVKQVKINTLFIPATSRSKKVHKTVIICEGDSAADLMMFLVKHAKVLSSKTCAIFSAQGVTMNPLKQINKHGMMTERLKNNKTLQGLAQIIGLEYGEVYSSTKQLNYQEIVIATDQDSDGIGKICSLLICFLNKFWPSLFKLGAVKRYRTPIVRIYNGKEVYKFYDEEEYHKQKHKWPRATVRYYKGLGSHSKLERKHMAQTYEEDLITYVPDERGDEAMYDMHGKNADIRKRILTDQSVGQYEDPVNLKISEQFDIDSKKQQLENVQRKLPSVYDGMNPVHRKVLATVRKYWKHNSVKKVFQLSGLAAEKMVYEHGDASMNSAVMHMAQIIPGANNIPLIRPVSGSLGSQLLGRKQNAQPRYTNIGYSICIDYLFPKADDPVLSYAEAEGQMVEPKYYVGIIPHSILEHRMSPATGWSYKSWARSYESVLKATRAAISDYPNYTMPNLVGELWLPDGMSVRMIGDSEYCMGSYTIDRNTLTITQLPIQEWSIPYVNFLKGLKTNNDKLSKNRFEGIIQSIDAQNGSDSVWIQIKLVPGWRETVETTKCPEGITPIEKFFKLYKKLTPNLNFLLGDKVVEYKSYDQIMSDWFEERKRLYESRIRYQLILLWAKVHLWECILTYISHNEGQYKGQSQESRWKQWESIECKYPDNKGSLLKLNKAEIKTPKYQSPEQLEKIIYSGDYRYIDQITESMYSKGQQTKIVERIKGYRAQIDDLNRGWRVIWLAELEKLDQQVKLGIQTGWQYKDSGYTFK